jgi:hypothetical protein
MQLPELFGIANRIEAWISTQSCVCCGLHNVRNTTLSSIRAKHLMKKHFKINIELYSLEAKVVIRTPSPKAEGGMKK